MTIFSGVVAILSPSLVSRLPTYATDKTKGPLALGTVLERMQVECGVSCSRTAENVCMVQGEWDAIRKAYSFLDHHNALNSLCKPISDDSSHTRDPSRESATKKARRDRSPEAPVATSTPVSALSYTPSHKYKLSEASLLRATNSPMAGVRVLGTASIVEELRQLRSESPMAASATTTTAIVARSSPTSAATTTTTSQGPDCSSSNNSKSMGSIPAASRTSSSSSSATITQGRSGAMKRKQGMPRKQLHNIGSTSSCSSSSAAPCPAHSDDEDVLDHSITEGKARGGGALLPPPLHAQDPPAFANGDSSIQIVAAWGNFKEEAIMGEMTAASAIHPKQEPCSSEEENIPATNTRYVYYQEAKGIKSNAPGTGVYTVQSDGHGGTVILPTVTEPVYVLNVSAAAAERADLSTSVNEESVMDYSNEALCHSGSEKEEGKWNSSGGNNSSKTGGANSKNLTARKSTSNRLAARKSTSQRTLLLLSKKVNPQGGGGGGVGGGGSPKASPCAKKGGKLSPQRRRGIIQGDSPIKGEFTCSYCQKIFNTKEAIHVHEEVYHTGRYKSLPSSSKSPLFECTQCGKSYMSKHALEEHLYTHVGMRPFACPYCAASFNHRKSLRRHVQLHNNVKRFDCPQCSKTFVRKDALESHLRVHKTEEDTSSNDVN